MAENRNQNQIIRKDARNCFVESLSDAFEIGRIHLAFATYDLSKPAGQRQTNNIHIYIAWMNFWSFAARLPVGNFGICCRTKRRAEINPRCIIASAEPLLKSLQNRAAAVRMG